MQVPVAYDDQPQDFGRRLMRSSGSFRVAALMVAGSLLLGSSAANASATLSPWLALSAFGTQSSTSAICPDGTTSQACAVQGTEPTPPVVGNIPIPPPPIRSANRSSGGFGISPLVLALGALAIGGLIYLLVHKKGDDEPVSPA
jgi:hypothetical protein